MKSNYASLPSAVFTIPPLVSVGMQEKEAKEKKDYVLELTIEILLAGHHRGE